MVPPRTPPPDDFADEEPEGDAWPEEEEEQLPEEPAPGFDEEAEEAEEEEEAFAEPETFEEEEFEEDEGEEGEEEALDELEAEELDMLTDDEAAESLPVDEVEELRKLRREAIELELEADAVGEDEFVCSKCFLVKRRTQLADKRRMLCRDCI
ncbi:MAG: DUF4193 family protein [Acidimicrobiia bacterium]|nr:DUF4193 family protein [Acidimicrobiia bacterium]